MRSKSIFISLVLLVFLLYSGVVLAAESSTNPILVITDGGIDSGFSGRFSGLCKDINDKLHNAGFFAQGFGNNIQYVNFVTYNEENGVIQITISMTDYEKLKQSSKREVYDIVLTSIKNSELTQNNKTKFYNYIVSQDTVISNLVRQLSDDVTADFMGAYTWFRPVASGISSFLSWLALAIFILLSFTITLDISYLVIPALNIWYSKVEEKEIFKSGVKYRFISLEAKKAYDEACASNGISFKSPISLYFSMKSKQLTLIAICLIYIVSGQIFGAISSFVDLFNGFLPK